MTTKSEFSWTSNISRRNEIVNIGDGVLSANHSVGAASWLTSANSKYESLVTALNSILRMINDVFPHYKLLLLVGTGAWQPDTRIVRYRKLWGGLQARGIKITDFAEHSEIMVSEDGKLKFFGSVKINKASLESVVNTILEERCNYLVALPKSASLDELLTIGWSGDLRRDTSLINAVIDKEGVIFSQVGEFDDLESGMLAISMSKIIELIANRPWKLQGP